MNGTLLSSSKRGGYGRGRGSSGSTFIPGTGRTNKTTLEMMLNGYGSANNNNTSDSFFNTYGGGARKSMLMLQQQPLHGKGLNGGTGKRGKQYQGKYSSIYDDDW